MLIIADGGATKADWVVVKDDGEQLSITTTGFNPNYVSGEGISEIIQQELVARLPFDLTGDIFYYGTGCWDRGRNAIVRAAIAAMTPEANFTVHHDLLGAARATCATSRASSAYSARAPTRCCTMASRRWTT